MFLTALLATTFIAVAGASSAQTAVSSAKGSDRTASIVVFAADTFRVVVDGEEIGVLRKNQTKKVSVGKGQHLILALNESGEIAWRRTVSVEADSQIVVEIEAPKPKRQHGKSTIIVRTDTPCSIKINGKPAGRVKPGEVRTVSVPSGDNILVATSVRWAWWKQEHTFYVKEQLQKKIEIDLGEDRLFYHQDEAMAVSDTHTGLVWVRAEIAEFQNWPVAVTACDSLEAGGHADWQMPSLEQLKTLMGDETKYFFRWYDKECPFHWTSTPSSDEEVYCVDVETREIHRISISRTRMPGKETMWDSLADRDPSPRSVCARPICVRVSEELGSQ